MKKIFQLTTLVALALVVFSCTKKEVSTEQFDTTAVVLKAYGPQPVVRGGILRFVGSNLDKVVTVTIPGVDPITPEVVTSGVHSEIRVTVPKDGPDVGYPVLTLADGGTLTGKTLLTYSEPIILEGFSPLSVYPGDKITITGDYLNLIHEVVFAGDAIVGEEDFYEHTRYKIVVGVPAESRTGKIALGTVDQTQIDETTDEGAALLATLNLIESEDELTVGTATGTFPEEAIKAGSVVTITGSHLMLTEEIQIGNYTVSEFDGDNSKISFPLSELASDGEVVLVMASGVRVPVGTLTTVAPVVSGVTPAPVKNGAVVTLAGSDLDLVTKLDFPNASGVEFAFAEGLITATVPEAAQEGDITLSLANGKTVTAELTLVKPTITAVAPTPVPAGENFTVTGTDLDLVKAVAIGEQEMEFEVVSATELTVKTDAATLGGTLSLTTANGTVVTFEDDIVFDYGSVTQVTALTEKAAPGESVTMTGSGFNAIESIYIGGVKVTSYSKREDAEMVFLMPEVEPGTYAPEFHLTTGETESPAGFSITYEDGPQPVEIVLHGSPITLSWSDEAGKFTIMKDTFEQFTAGTKMRFYITGIEGEGQIQINYGNWSSSINFPVPENDGGVIKIKDTSLTLYEVEFDQTLIDNCKANYSQWDQALNIQGTGISFSKVTAVIPPASPLEPIKSTDIVLVDWDDHGGHNGSWDQPDSWGGVKTELLDDANGGKYLHVTEGGADQLWTVCCNHQSNYTENVPSWVLDDASKYVLKIDIKLEGSASAADMTLNPVFGDNWPGGKGAGLFPATTGGEWITVTIDLGLTGELDCSSGTNGFMAANVPTGLCLDNFRFSLK